MFDRNNIKVGNKASIDGLSKMAISALSRLSTLLTLSMCVSVSSWANSDDYVLEIKNHLFYPSELVVPVNKKFKLVIINHDHTPEEFDSFDLNREKLIYPHSKAVIYIGPLKAGRFNFFGEYNPNTAIGALLATETLEIQIRDNLHVN